MKKLFSFSSSALILSLFILAITLFTALVDTPTFINRIHTTIILWNLPFVTMIILICAYIRESGDFLRGLFRLLAVVALVGGFFCTNFTKNTVQDVVSNTSNYVDVAVATIDKEAENVEGYAEDIEDAIESAAKKEERKKKSKYDSERNYNEPAPAPEPASTRYY